MEYAIVIERSESGFGAYVPDLPGCVAVAERRRRCTLLSARPSSFISTNRVSRSQRFEAFDSRADEKLSFVHEIS